MQKVEKTLRDLQTPAILLDLDAMEHNLKKYADLAAAHGKQIWPMVKTHKSTELLRLQAEYGATGFLCGTLDECEAACREGYQNIMYAYPVASECSVKRVIRLAQSCNFIIRIDGLESAEILNVAAEAAGVKLSYTIIIDSGLHRFGIQPEETGAFLKKMLEFSNLVFRGISSHPGHVYGASCAGEIGAYARAEVAAIQTAVAQVRALGMEPELVSSGSTPTFAPNIGEQDLQIYHPGNYIFNDCIQISTETATEEECALSVLASVISHPSEHLFICDAGAKCLGLDKGAHGNSSVVGHGRVVGHPELTVDSLSEEVGKLKLTGAFTDLKVGDLIRIIPNHSCSTANLTDYYIGVRGEKVEQLIEVDIRGNKTRKSVGEE